MCGHVYHESCVEEENFKRVCKICNPSIKEVIKTKKLFDEKAKDSQQFFTELEHEENKMKTIAHFYGTGLFSEVQKAFEEL
mmetsp:Transcript_11666/g.13245  ORF Transcript_11666/g.13245 Transcript_11666/m.13245 type:complete len:81 (+) Transcript_11666:908-1150(+)